MSQLELSIPDREGKPKHSFPLRDAHVLRLATLRWRHWFVYMQNNSTGNVRGYGGIPGDQGELIFTPNENGTYLISTKKWPNWYFYMQDIKDGNIRGWQGDPGPQGHWRVKPRGDGSILLCTEKWDNWYMYMQDNAEGNMRAWQGDPGPQGYFVLSCDLLMFERPSSINTL